MALIRRIEICGGIASGKTTLAKALCNSGYIATFEEFDANPFFNLFYNEPGQYSFETELSFLLTHVAALKRNRSSDWQLSDFSLALDMAYAKTTLDADEQKSFSGVLASCLHQIKLPALVVRLICTTESKIARIQSRGRSQEQEVSPSFLEQLEGNIVETLGSYPFAEVPQLVLDSEKIDFREARNVDQVLKKIKPLIGKVDDVVATSQTLPS